MSKRKSYVAPIGTDFIKTYRTGSISKKVPAPLGSYNKTSLPGSVPIDNTPQKALCLDEDLDLSAPFSSHADSTPPILLNEVTPDVDNAPIDDQKTSNVKMASFLNHNPFEI